MPTTSTARSVKSTPRKTGAALPVRKARSHTTAPKLARAPAPRTAEALVQPPVRKARSARAGVRPAAPVDAADAVIRAATGRSWAQWFRLLDRFAVADAGHSATVRHLADAHACPRWWRQRIAEAYAQARGLREPTSRGLAANTSRTLAVAIDDLYRAWQGRGAQKWLGAKFKVHRANENRSLRLDWPDHTSVEIYFWAKGERRSQVNVMHRQLGSAAEVAEKKRFWAGALDKLQAALE